MREALIAFFKQKTTIIGIVTAMMFQIIFSVVWMTGYEGVNDRMDRLTIAIVNEDPAIGATIVESMEANLPFATETGLSLEAAQQELDKREVQMVVHIPADFSAQLQVPDQSAALPYYINESNPALIKSIMGGAAGTITATVNKQAIAAGAQAVLTQVQLPEAQVKAMAGALSERVVSQFTYTNQVQGMSNQMIPMMMVLASYVGAMIMAMNLEQSSMFIGARVNRWKKFGARVVINIGSAVVVALIGSGLVVALGGQMDHGFLTMWGFQVLFLLTFMFTAQLFLILFSMAGMLFNIILLSAQLVSSGAMVPRELLSDFYLSMGELFPATYAVEGMMNLLFGGPSMADDVVGLLLVMAAAIAIGALGTALRKPGGTPGEAMPRAESVA